MTVMTKNVLYIYIILLLLYESINKNKKILPKTIIIFFFY